MLGTANGAGIRESVHPCTTSTCCGGKLGFGSCPRFALCLGFCGRMPPKWGPCGTARVRRTKSEGGRTRCAPVRRMYMDVHPANPGAPSRSRKAGCLETVPPGGVFLWLPFFAQAKKVTRSPAGRVEALPFNCKQSAGSPSNESNPLARRASGSFAFQLHGKAQYHLQMKVTCSLEGSGSSALQTAGGHLPVAGAAGGCAMKSSVSRSAGTWLGRPRANDNRIDEWPTPG